MKKPMGKISKLGSLSVLAMALCLAITSCNKNPAQSTAQQTSTDQQQTTAQEPNADPAQTNLASASQQPDSQAPAQQAAAPAQQAPAQQPQASYPPVQPANQPQSAYPPAQQTSDQNYAYGTDDTDSGEQAVYAQQPPPPLPEYSQPECPGENYMWTPGSWSYASAGYYWVPGVWVLSPYVGALWTPPYWGFGGGRYRWYHGYWGQHIGFYGGINYGFGYVGRGYEGGYWNRGAFDYNRSVNNVNTTIIHNVYNYRVTNITNVRVSYVGGSGGLNVRPTPAELAVLHEPRIAPVPAQVQHMQQAAANRAQFAAVNHGRPATLVAAQPLVTAYHAPAPRPSAVPGARTLPPVNVRQAAVSTPQTRTQMQPVARPGERAVPNERPATRPNPVAHAPAPNANRPSAEARPEARPAPQPRPTERPTPQPRAEPRPAAQPAQPRAEPPRPAVQPRAEPRPAPPAAQPPRAEPRPAAQPKAEPKPAPQARQEARPAPKPPAKEPAKRTDERERQ